MTRFMLIAWLLVWVGTGVDDADAHERCANGGPSDNIIAEDIEFARAIQNAVDHGDRPWLARHAHYPLWYDLNAKSYTIKNRRSFLAKFDKLFIYDVVFAIRHTDVDCLFKTDRGVMMGQGELWFSDFPDKKGSHQLIISIKTADQGR